MRGWLASMLGDGSGFCDAVFLAQAHRAATGRDPAALREIAEGTITAEMLKEPEPEVEALVPEADNQSMFRAPQFGLGD